MKLTMLGREKNYAGPVEVMQVIRDLAPEYEKRALGLFCGGRALELNQQVGEDASLHPITFQNEEGRRIYERSLRFVLLLAVQRVLVRHGCSYDLMELLLEDMERAIKRLTALPPAKNPSPKGSFNHGR